MDAPLSRYKVVIKLPPPEIRKTPKPPIDLPLPIEGLDVEINEILTHSDGTLLYKNKRVIVHIRDAANHLPRFHLAECITLIEMKHTGRFDRYVVSNGDDGFFHIRMGNNSLQRKKLPVCQNCLDRLSWKGFRRESMSSGSRQIAVENFSINEFFNIYPHTLHKQLPLHTEQTAPINDYPTNWAEISSELRRQLGYVCQSCHLVLGEKNKKFLHVHHLNGLKMDCRVENLKCLCISCHTDQPMHEHLKISDEYIEFKSLQLK